MDELTTDDPDPEPGPRPAAGEVSIRAAADQRWDVVVIGAGPAGALVARLLAERGRSVLLIEAKRFPRHKVCGGCLNGRTLEILGRVGLGTMPLDAGGVPLTRFEVFCSGRSASLAIPDGVSLSRHRFDDEMLSSAAGAGCRLLAGATATVLPDRDPSGRTILVQHGTERVHLSAACVVCADGLRRSSTRRIPELASRVAAGSYAGVGTWLSAAELSPEAGGIPSGAILMALGPGGYVGLARAECQGLSVAAALSPGAIKAAGSAALAVSRILDSAGLPWPGSDPELGWTGTSPLTSSADRVATERLFAVGDAAGYVEPFTGEGIAAALESAWLVAPLVDRAVSAWDESLARGWEQAYARSIRRRQWICRGLSRILHHPVTQPILPWLVRFPALARPIVARINDRTLAAPPLVESPA